MRAITALSVWAVLITRPFGPIIVRFVRWDSLRDAAFIRGIRLPGVPR